MLDESLPRLAFHNPRLITIVIPVPVYVAFDFKGLFIKPDFALILASNDQSNMKGGVEVL